MPVNNVVTIVPLGSSISDIFLQTLPTVRFALHLSSASAKTESENNRPAAPGTVATLPAVNY